jgi:hypothetical protein
MDKLKVEYLVIINTNSSFCNSKKAFNSLLSSIDEISINKNKLVWQKIEIDYELQTEEIEKDKQRFFHLKLQCNDLSKVDDFSDLLRSLRDVLYKASNKQFQTLWDDLTLYYSNKAYPLIHDIENLMRKLITKFMLTNIGLGWEKGAIPDELKKNSRAKPNDSNYLYEVDFIQLSDFLFLNYETVDTKTLFDKIKKISDINEISIDDLKEFIPKSNWDRYFANIVDCDNNYLKKRWSALYDFRCKVAHNNTFTKYDYEQTINLIDEIKVKLLKAIDNLDKIQISQEDKEIVAENIASKTNELYGIFINQWKSLIHDLFEIINTNREFIDISLVSQYRSQELNRIRYDLRMILNILSKNKLIDNLNNNELMNLQEFRNILIHRSDLTFSEDELKYKISQLTDFSNQILKNVIIRLEELKNNPILKEINKNESN